MHRHLPYNEEDEQKARGISLDLTRLLLPLARPHVWALLVCAFLLAGYSILSIVGPLLIRHAIDVNFVNKDIRGLAVTVLAFFFTLLGSFVFAYFQRIQLEKVGQKIIQMLRESLFEKLTRFSLSYFDRNSVGTVISRIESDTEALRMLFTDTVVTLLGDLLMLLGMFVVMFTVDWRLAAILFTIMPIVFLNIYLYNLKGAPLFLAVRRQMAVIYGFLEEYIGGMSIVQAFSREAPVAQWLETENERKFRIDFRAELLVILFFNFIFFMNTVGTVLVLWFGTKWAMDGSITIGTLIMFLAYIRRFFEPLFHLSEQINVIQRAFAGAERIFDILSREAAVHSPKRPVPLNNHPTSITFDHVWFAYEAERWVVQDLTFTIPEGQRWALVGATGGGKTTVINLLLRFYDPQRGRIFLNGTDIREIALDELRARIGLVLQDIYLFPMNIRENLRLEQGMIDDNLLWDSLKAVQAAPLIENQEKKLDTYIAERGRNFSQGERQLLSFARALVRDPEILVLDEATSAVDPLTEKNIQSALQVLLNGRTSLIIAHRLQTILNADHILVLHQGRIVEQGTHPVLLEQRGLYFKLYQLQHHDTQYALNN
ncbi:ABC transporter ATP-binding protein [bacterium]|nr:ABC transporter ATP-binding protein [bacterium]